jgi:deoxyribose-phosphate aldolase
MTAAELLRSFDSTNLKLDAAPADIEQLCREAAEHSFFSVMIYPGSIALAKQTLQGTPVRIGTVIGFPSGRFSTAAKRADILFAKEQGADEVDIVMNYPALLAGHTFLVETELTELARGAHEQNLLVKVIVETCFLPAEAQLEALRICEAARADFIKTSTGFGSAGAQLGDVERWKSHRRGTIQIKASGGVKTLADATRFLEAGCTRLGTSSALAILNEFQTGRKTAAASSSY